MFMLVKNVCAASSLGNHLYSCKTVLKLIRPGEIRRLLSSNSGVSTTRDGSMFVSWHPEPAFPYENTLPMPRRPVELAEGDSVLKVQYVLDERIKRRTEGPDTRDLMKMFFTSLHPWRPMPRKRYRNQNPAKDRQAV